MKQGTLIQALEEVLEALGTSVRYEKGDFRGGPCMKDGQPLVMLNKRHPSDVHLHILADVLRERPVDTIYLRPAVREALEALWDESPSET